MSFRRPRPLAHALTTILFAAIILAGCMEDNQQTEGHHDDGHHGGADDHHGTGGASDHGTLQMTGAEDMVINVSAGAAEEFRFTPDTLEVHEGERIGIVFTNAGAIEHEFDISSIGFHLHAEAGDEVSGAFLAPAPGEYDIGCHVTGHLENGMRGTLVVT